MIEIQPYAAVIFDLDGTLVNTMPDIGAAVNTALDVAGVPSLPDEQVQQLVGRGLANALRGALMVSGLEGTEEQVGRYLPVLMEYYEKHPCDFSLPYKGIPALLRRLEERGTLIGVLSNKADSLVQEIIPHIFPTIHFHFIRGQRADKPMKPSPQALDDFFAGTSLTEADICYVGDSEVDWQFASQFKNMGKALVSWGFRSREQLIAAGIPAPLDTVEELEEAINGRL